MATDNMSQDNKDPEVKMPDVGTPISEKSAGKWAVWFIIIVAIALIITFLVK